MTAAFSLPESRPAGRPSLWRVDWWRLAVLATLISLLGGLAAYQVFYRHGLARLQAANAQRLAFYAASLESTLDKHEPLPHLVGLEQAIVAALQHPGEPVRLAAANRYLKTVSERSRVAAVYLMNTEGLTLAASNWGTEQSFVGQRYTYRPYFREALAGGVGRIYAVGATTREPGYFIAAPVRHDGRILGVVAVKVSLADFEKDLARSGERVAVADAAGVLFLAAPDAWKFRTLRPLTPELGLALAETRQYGDHALTPLVPGEGIDPDQPGREVRFDPVPVGAHWPVAQSVGPLNWRMVLFAPLAETRQTALALAAAVAFALALMAALAAMGWMRVRRRQERASAAAALEQAHAELARRIADRTADLEARLAELQATEAILRQTRDDAVQAGKLAVLGQLAAGITHEINQPLAALTTLSANAAQFLVRGDLDEVRDNLTLIQEMAQRLGRIVAQFKAFARKAPAELGAVSLADALQAALLIMESRRREVGASVEVQLPPALASARADGVRLEQVLVNLLKNALEAAAGQREPRLQVTAHQAADHQESAGRLVLTVADNGPGISADALPHLFEPFYSTKTANDGLGLGLAISRAIIESFGGRLEARNRSVPDGGGAEFVIILDPA